MIIARTQNATRNILFGVLNRLYQIFVPFLLRTVLIYTLGMQYLGLNSLFASVLQVLNLAELGVGNALVYSMYKPIVEDDTKKICALMHLYRAYYRIIGLVVLILGLILLPFIPNLISGETPENVNIYILYLINLGATVLSYWLFAYKNSLLVAHQRADILSKISIAVTTVQYVLQLASLILFRNYYVYIGIVLAIQVINNLVTAYISDKMYPTYRAAGELTNEEVRKINQSIKDLFTSKLGAIILNSADTIVISAFLGLTVLAVYNNYFYILSSIIAFITVAYNSITAGIGNSIVTETEEKNYNDLKKFTFLIAWVSCFCSTCLLCLYQPFMELWVGKENMLKFSIVVCLCVYFYIYEINMLLNTFKDASGIWHEDRFRPLITSLLNLFLNIVLVQFMGLYGVVLSTVISMVSVGMPWLLHNLFTVLFKRNKSEYVLLLIKYGSVTVFAWVITYLLGRTIVTGLVAQLVIRFAVCMVIPNMFFFVIFRKTMEFKMSVKIFDSVIGDKIRRKIQE